jgi:hypothetical protein
MIPNFAKVRFWFGSVRTQWELIELFRRGVGRELAHRMRYFGVQRRCRL